MSVCPYTSDSWISACPLTELIGVLQTFYKALMIFGLDLLWDLDQRQEAENFFFKLIFYVADIILVIKI